MTDKIVVACIPVRHPLELAAMGVPPMDLTKYSVSRCDACGFPVWLGVRSAEAVKLGVEKLCLECMAKLAQEYPDLEEITITSLEGEGNDQS